VIASAEAMMSRDHRRLRAFEDAHQLTLAVYRQTREFPKDEWFGIRRQMRRAAVSIPSNLVEGSARPGTRDYLRFCNIALGSACELKYVAGLSQELGIVQDSNWSEVTTRCDAVVKQLQRLVQALERQLAAESHPVHRGSNPP
jgi:four helix bundle protein